MMFLVLFTLLAGVTAGGPCCNNCTSPEVKYFSTDAVHGFCGETCLDPKKFSLFKKFESNLTLANDNHPCREQRTPTNDHNYTDYFKTVTHGDPFGVIKATLDLYAPTEMPDHSCCETPLIKSLHCIGTPRKPKSLFIFGTGPFCCPASATPDKPCAQASDNTKLVAAPGAMDVSVEANVQVVNSTGARCCTKCTAPQIKYFSTDAFHGFCGETCLEPKKFSLYKKFEPNLTLATDNTPCREQVTPSNDANYTEYFSTVTHGDPFGIITATLDLYAPTGMPDHRCCKSPFITQLHCVGIPGYPVSLKIKGTGPFCCPKGATETNPCPDAADDTLAILI